MGLIELNDLEFEKKNFLKEMIDRIVVKSAEEIDIYLLIQK